MAFITLAGTLRDPTSELAVGDQIRFTHKSTTGETVEGAVSVLTIDPSGTYSKDLQYGLVLVEYKDVRTSQFKNLGVATVNGSNPATSIPELLNALVPVSSAELIEFQAILADAVTARNEAEAFANSIDLINDLSQAYIFNTVAEYKASAIVFPVGKAIYLKDRGADFIKEAGTTGNLWNRLQSTSISQTIVLREYDEIYAKHYGLTGLLNSDDSALTIKLIIDARDRGVNLNMCSLSALLDTTTDVTDVTGIKIHNGGFKRGNNVGVAYALRFIKPSNLDLERLKIFGELDGSEPDLLGGDLGLKLEGCSDITIDKCHFSLFKDSCLTCETYALEGVIAKSVKVTNSTFKKVFQTSTTQDGIEDVIFSGNTFEGLGGSSKFASRATAAGKVKFINNNVKGASDGVRLAGYGSSFVTGNTFEDCDNMVYVETNVLAPTATPIKNINVTNNIGVNCNSGIQLNNHVAADLTFTELKNINLNYNTFDGVTGTNSDDGLIIFAGKAFKSINIIGNTAEGLASDGIVYKAEAPSGDIELVISGTKLTNGVAGKSGLLIQPLTGTLKDVTLRDNTIKDCSGATIVDIENFTISNFNSTGNKSQTVITGDDGIIENSKFIATTGQNGLRFTGNNVDLVRNKTESNSSFALRIEAGSTNINEYFPSDLGARSLFVVPTGQYRGTGSPEGVFAASQGSTFQSELGFYVKDSGTSAVGWVLK